MTIHRLLEGECRASHIADGRESAQQHILHDTRRAIGDHDIRQLGILAWIDDDGGHVHMAINQTRHQGPSGKIDPAGSRVLDRSVGYFLDQAS